MENNNKIAYITDNIYLKHDTGIAHPESKERLIAKDIPYIFFLEDGYDVKALGENVKVTLEEMCR